MGENGKNLSIDIASLIMRCLHPIVQKALGVLRVVRNEAVHPGQIDIDYFKPIITICFTKLKEVKEADNKLPDSKKRSIDNRDKKAKEYLMSIFF